MKNQKVFHGFMWLWVFIVILGLFGVFGINHISDNRSKVYDDTLKALNHTTNIRGGIQNLRVIARDISLNVQNVEMVRSFRYDVSKSFDDINWRIGHVYRAYEKEKNSEALYLMDIVKLEFESSIEPGLIQMLRDAEVSGTSAIWKQYGPIEESLTRVDGILYELIDNRSRTLNTTADLIPGWTVQLIVMTFVVTGIASISLALLSGKISQEIDKPTYALLKYVQVLNNDSIKITDEDVEIMINRYENHTDPIGKLIFRLINYWHRTGVLHDSLKHLDLPPRQARVEAIEDISITLNNMLIDADDIADRARKLELDFQRLSTSAVQHSADVQNSILLFCGLKIASDNDVAAILEYPRPGIYDYDHEPDDISNIFAGLRTRTGEEAGRSEDPDEAEKHVEIPQEPEFHSHVNHDFPVDHEPTTVQEPIFDKRNLNHRHFGLDRTLYVVDHETGEEYPIDEARKRWSNLLIHGSEAGPVVDTNEEHCVQHNEMHNSTDRHEFYPDKCIRDGMLYKEVGKDPVCISSTELATMTDFPAVEYRIKYTIPDNLDTNDPNFKLSYEFADGYLPTDQKERAKICASISEIMVQNILTPEELSVQDNTPFTKLTSLQIKIASVLISGLSE